MDRQAGDGFRRIAAYLGRELGDRGARSVLFASARCGEGTSATALLVARCILERGGNPLILEMNRSRPSLARWFGLDRGRTVEAVATGALSARECVQKGPDALPILPAGDGAAPEAMGSAHLLRRLLDEVEPLFDPVLIDGPSILDSPEAIEIGRVVPRLLLVVEAGRTREEVLDRVRRDLTLARIELLGAVLNKHRRLIPGPFYRLLAGG